MLDISPGQLNRQQQHVTHQNNENGWILIAAFFGLGFLFSVLALVCALIALCR